MFKTSLLAISFFLLLFTTTLSAQTQTTAPIKIGAILPLTGVAASWGEAIQNGIELAISKMPEEERSKFQVVYEDDERNSQKSVSAFKKLVEVEHVVALISATAQPSLAIAPLAEVQHIPLISIAVPPQISAGRAYTVMLYSTPEDMAQLLIKEATARKYKRIARISSIHDGRHAMKQFFDKYNNGQIEVVLDDEYPPDDKDFRTFLAKIRPLNVDAIYVNLLLGQAGVFARQARELQLNKPLFCSEMFEDPNEVAISQGALIGHWFVNQASPTESFEKEYFSRYPNSKIFNATNGYDAISLITAALKQGNTAESINHFLHQVRDFPGVLGRYTLTPDNRFALPFAVKEVTVDGFHTISQQKLAP